PVGQLYVLLLAVHAALCRCCRLRWLALPLLVVLLWHGYQGFLPARSLAAGNSRLAWMPALTAANFLPTLAALAGVAGWGLGQPLLNVVVVLLLLAWCWRSRTLRRTRLLLLMLWLGPPLVLLGLTFATGTNHLVGRALFPAPLLFLLLTVRALRRWPLPAVTAVLLLALLPTLSGTLSYLAYYRATPLRYPLASRAGLVVHSSLLSAFPFAVLAPQQRHAVVRGAGINCPVELAGAVGIAIVAVAPDDAHLVNLPMAPGAQTVRNRHLLATDYQWEQPLEYWLPGN
ncbi:MAG TPA: hypothetical protein PKM88_10125, partial [bacterium]|nr:hypothetical protein [bacterium]